MSLIAYPAVLKGRRFAPLVLALLGSAPFAFAADNVVTPPTIVVTAAKIPWDLATTPAMVSVVSGDELRARGVNDLRTALATVAGVDVAPGGDAGPAGSVPGMWGLKEFDAFLLLVDGVPYGGAFNPAVPTLDLTGVDRIEVVRGAAPVTYGATSFVGVIHVIHSGAGSTPQRISAGGGTRSTALGAISGDLPAIGGLRQSFTLNGETREFAQQDSSVRRVHGLYRSGMDLAGGTLGVDLDLTLLRQAPYSPHPREGAALSDRFALDANVNPLDGRQDQDRAQLNARFARPLGSTSLTTTLSIAHTETHATRGFLRADFATDGITPNADGFRQRVGATDVYFDSYLSMRPTSRVNAVVGLDWLYGKGLQTSANFEYAVLPDGSDRPLSSALPIDETTRLSDERNFGGLYSQIEWQPTDDWNLTAGARLNRTVETRAGETVPSDTLVATADADRRETTRLSGVIGASYSLWSQAADHVAVFGDLRSSYKPAAVDFGPEAEGGILRPETGKSGELGLRGRVLDGRWTWEASIFQMDFRNLVIHENVGGLPALANAGAERFRGAELETAWLIHDSLRLIGTYAYHDAAFTDYARLQPDGSIQQLAGNQLELSPRHLAAIGLLLAPPRGWMGSIIASHTGSRFLNKGNSSTAAAFTMIDASLGYRGARWEVRLDGYNLSDRRDPVAESELGDAQFYRLPGRSVVMMVTSQLR
jgi:iron complex outermembrane receptor protein